MRRVLLIGVWWMLAWASTAQPDSLFLQRRTSLRLEPFAMVQFWTTWTPRPQIWEAGEEAYRRQPGLLDPHLRRTRLGLRGEVQPGLKYTAIMAFDLVGHDPLSGTFGGGNNAAFPQIGIIDAFAQYRFTPRSQHLYLTMGYFRPLYGREAITSGFMVNSMEKPTSQIYIRKHLLSINPGRASGLNAGGQWSDTGGRRHIRYDVGIFSPPFAAAKGFPTALTARLVTQWGDPEDPAYTLSHRINYFGQRRGLSLALGAARVSGTERFRDSRAIGLDLLANSGRWQIDGEYHLLERRALPGTPGPGTYLQTTGHLRAGYNLLHRPRGVLEAVVTWMFYQGAMHEAGQELALRMGSPAGREQSVETALTWWFSPTLCVQGAYTFRRGNSGDAGGGATLNPYFFQSEIGPIRRGDWFGLGLRFVM